MESLDSRSCHWAIWRGVHGVVHMWGYINGAGLDGDDDVEASSHAKEERRWMMAVISPLSGAPEQQDLIPPRRESVVSPLPPPRMDLGKLGRNFAGETTTC